MAKYTFSLDLPYPVETVFQYLDDAETAKQWIGGLESIEAITDGGNRVGAKSKHVYNENGRIIEMIEETIAYDPPNYVKLHGMTDGFELYVAYRLVPTATGTRIEYESETRMTSWFMKVLSPLINASANNKVCEDFERFEALIHQDEAT